MRFAVLILPSPSYKVVCTVASFPASCLVLTDADPTLIHGIFLFLMVIITFKVGVQRAEY